MACTKVRTQCEHVGCAGACVEKREATFLVVCMLWSISILRALPSGHLSSTTTTTTVNTAQTSQMFNIPFIPSFVRASSANFWWRFAEATISCVSAIWKWGKKKGDSCGFRLETVQTYHLKAPGPCRRRWRQRKFERIKFQWDVSSDCLRFWTSLLSMSIHGLFSYTKGTFPSTLSGNRCERFENQIDSLATLKKCGKIKWGV